MMRCEGVVVLLYLVVWSYYFVIVLRSSFELLLGSEGDILNKCHVAEINSGEPSMPFLMKVLVIAVFLLCCKSAYPISFLPKVLAGESCGERYTNNTIWTGRKIGNITYDLPPNLVYQAGVSTCCSIATSLAEQRSENSTKPISWSQSILGPSQTHKGQLSLNCIAYDYGAKRNSGNKSFGGMTAPLKPFPPPPPSCKSFKTKSVCPERCFWANDVCLANPPIKCAKQEGILVNNGPLCVHIEVNTTKWGEVTYSGDAASYNETVIVAPQNKFIGDTWYSMGDGLNGPAKTLSPFRYCTQYNVKCNDCEAMASTYLAICITLDSVYDLQISVNQSLFRSTGSKWRDDPFIAKVIISDL